MKIVNNIKSSFAAKLSFMLFIGTFIVVTCVYAINNFRTRNHMVKEAVKDNAAMVDLFISKIGKEINLVEHNIKSRDMLFKEYYKKRDVDALDAMIKDVAKECNVREVFYALRPRGERTYMADALKEPDGKINVMRRTRNYKYYLHTYYLVPEKYQKDYWTAPYFTTIASQRAITFSHPIIDTTGDMIAVLGADILLETLTDTLSANVAKHSPIKGSYLMLVSKDGRYLAHPDKKKIANETYITDARENDCPELEIIVRKILDGESGNCIANLYGQRTIVTYAQMPELEWGIMLATPYDTITSVILEYIILSFVLMFIGFLIMGFVIYRIIWSMSKPLNVYSHASARIAAGDFDTPVEMTFSSGDELEKLGKDMDDMRVKLKNYYEDIQISAAQRESMEKELSIAHDIQMSMLPVESEVSLSNEYVKVNGYLNPAKEVGGDLWQYMLKDGKLMFIIGDVSGKGVPASLVMAQTVCLFKAQDADSSPLDLVMLINSLLSENNERNMFETLIVGKLDLSDGKLSFCNAGHDPMLLVRDGKVEEIPMNRNLPVGLIEDFQYRIDSLTMQPGDKILLYTDGIPEAENEMKELYSLKRLENALLENCEASTEGIIHSIREDLHKYVESAPQSDDITMVCINYRKMISNTENLTRTIVFKNQMSEVSRIAEFIEGIGEELSIDFSVMNGIQLAIEEAVVNIINYAYPDKTDCDSSLRVNFKDNVLTFILTDSGIPFDPTGKQDPDVSLDISDRPIGGLGIFLVKKIMNEVSYEYISDQNVLTMKKELKTK